MKRIKDTAYNWKQSGFKNYNTNLLVELPQSNSGPTTRSQTRSQDRLANGQFGNIHIEPALDLKRTRYSDTTIILSLQSNILEISCRAWESMLNLMKDLDQLHSSAEIPSYRSINRYQLMLPTIC